LSVYFLQNQWSLYRTYGNSHFKDFWNIIDIINP
jgi:hypothetical protein